jgi:gliding motility-associated protein GldM
MAGGKETPRQRLIGLMYLVLLALLALQVSSAIMEKFKFLDDSLQHANTSADNDNDIMEKQIAQAVKDNGNRSEDLKVLDQATKVRKEAKEIKDYIDALRADIIKKTGGLENPEDPQSMYLGAKEETEIEIMMVGGNKNGKGYQLKTEVNKFVDDLNAVIGDEKKLPYLALDAKQDPRIPKNSEQRNKDFSELNFAQTPMVAAMATLSNLEAEILKHETEALAHLQSKVGLSQLKFDNVFAMYRAESRVVAAGTKYTAELFMAASSSKLTPTIVVDGRTLPVSGDGRGKLEFTATAGAYDSEGNAKKTWNGKITIKNKGQDTTFDVKGEYVVAKPVIQIQSASVSALYKNCGNELNVQVPALGSTYQPTFKASGADVINGAKKGLVTLVPNSPNVKLSVYSGGNLIGDQDFKVRLIPKPEIIASSNGKPVDTKVGVNAGSLRSVQMQAKPDESFKNFLPSDARYKITEWNAILVRGKRPVKTKNFATENGDFSDINSSSQPGDRVVIEVKTVKRANFRNSIEDVNVGTPIINVPIN